MGQPTHTHTIISRESIQGEGDDALLAEAERELEQEASRLA